jgi:hypothetical protein
MSAHRFARLACQENTNEGEMSDRKGYAAPGCSDVQSIALGAAGRWRGVGVDLMYKTVPVGQLAPTQT